MKEGEDLHRHWTRMGTFRITTEIIGGSTMCVLWLGERKLMPPYFTPWSAAASISLGEHDKTLGLKASELGVPPDPDDWNSFR